jgi:putative membrane protein
VPERDLHQVFTELVGKLTTWEATIDMQRARERRAPGEVIMGNWGHGMDMWGDGGGFHAWMAVWWFFVIVGIALLVYLAVRAFSSKADAPVASGAAPSGGVQASSARLILEERLARGEISADEFRELIGVLEAP